MRYSPLMLLLVLISLPALPQAGQTPLNLDLPDNYRAPVGSSTSGPFASDTKPLATTGPGDPLQIHGRITTGIGLSRGHGTASTESAVVDLHKNLDSGSAFDMQLGVSNYRGFSNMPYGNSDEAYGGYGDTADPLLYP